jgi:NTE family protein
MTEPEAGANPAAHSGPAGEADREALDAILAHYLFERDPAALDLVQNEVSWIDLPTGAVLFEQDETSRDSYFVLSGRLRAIQRDKDGKSIRLGEIGRGEMVGEMAMLSGEKRSATIIAMRPTRLARLGLATFEKIIAIAPAIAMQTMRLLIERFRKADRARNPLFVPTTIALVPATRDVDLAGLAQALEESAATRGVSMRALAAGPDGDTGEIADRIRTAEMSGAFVLLLTDMADTAWTRRCLSEADELVLVAEASARDAPTAIGEVLGHAEQVNAARRTLLLLHAADVASPQGTSAWLARCAADRHIHIRPALERDRARLFRLLTGRAIGLVFSGGGARGLAQIGVLRALEESGVAVDLVGGTSMGAVIAAWCAMEVEGEALMRASQRAFGKSPSSDYNLLPLISLVRGERTLEITRHEVREATGGHETDSEDCWKSFFCIASNFTAQRETVLTRGPHTRNIVASYSIPGIFPPQIIDGHLMFDGGSFNNFPVDVMRRMGASRVIGIDMLVADERRHVIEKIPSPGALARDRLRKRENRRFRLPSLPEILLTASFVSAFERQRSMRDLTDLYFQPAIRRVGLLDWSKIGDAIEQGYRHAKEVLSAMKPEELDAFR